MEPVADSQSPPRKSGNKTLLVVLLVLAGGGLFVLLACAGCAAWLYNSYQKSVPLAEASANAFLDDLQAGRVDEAYASTSNGFHSGMALDKFQEFVQKFPILKSQTSRSTDGTTMQNNTNGKFVIFKFTLRSPDNAMNCTLYVVEEASGQWKVQRINVP